MDVIESLIIRVNPPKLNMAEEALVAWSGFYQEAEFEEQQAQTCTKKICTLMKKDK